MKSRFSYATALFSAALLLCATTAAQAGYFVRPYVSLGAGVIDGYEANGATERQESFATALQAQVSLDQGTIRNYLEVNGVRGQSAGVMGDRLTVDNAEGTQMAFAFNFDGNITAPARDPNLNSTLQIAIFASLYVFDSSVGATYLNFDLLPGALVGQRRALDFSNPTEALDTFVDDTLSGSFIVGAGRRSFDVFMSLAIVVSPNNNPGTVTMDFMNTGTARVDTAPGVVFTSDSGVFLGSAQTLPVPEPGTYLLMSLGLVAVLRASRRRVR